MPRYSDYADRRQFSRSRKRSYVRSARRYGGRPYYRRVNSDYDDDFDGDARDFGISVVDQRGRPVAVSIAGNTISDYMPPYEDRSIYANTRRRSRF